MEKPVANWNISRNKLIFMENTDSNVIWIVKLSMTTEPVVYKFTLSRDLVKDNVNSFYETAKSNFHIPTEEGKDEEDKEMNESSRALVDDEKLMKIIKVNVDERMKDMPDYEMMQSLGEIKAE